MPMGELPQRSRDQKGLLRNPFFYARIQAAPHSVKKCTLWRFECPVRACNSTAFLRAFLKFPDATTLRPPLRTLDPQASRKSTPRLLSRSTRVSMYFLPTLSADELQRYHRAVARSTEVRNHFDMLQWLQGDIQRYLPHDILIAAWGDFEQGPILHDIISPLAGVRSRSSNGQTVSPMMRELFARWNALGKRSFALHVGDGGFLLQQALLEHELGSALKRMRYATVHGIVDERGSHDCLYVSFSATTRLGKEEPGAMAAMLPYIDTALRQVSHLPHQNKTLAEPAGAAQVLVSQHYHLTQREHEVLHWVAKGKTNIEIALILEISAFTVKNHMQRMFKKLDVSNRAQAVSKLVPVPGRHGN